jgi:hypothetical protein
VENTFAEKSQSHILVTSTPDSLTPSPPPTLLASVHNSTSLSAQQAADLFLLEVSAFSTRLGNAVLVFDGGWFRDEALWQSVQKVGSMCGQYCNQVTDS